MSRKFNISFWQMRDKPHYQSHSKGLDKEQIEALQSLKVGDRLVLFVNDREGDTQPDLNLKLSQPKPADEDGGL